MTKRLKYFSLALLTVLTALFVYRQVLLSQIPQAEKKITVKVSRESIPIPKRPGVKSLRIVGPPLKTVKFQLDFKHNPEPINWTYLERIDRKADVMIEGRIDDDGNFKITKVLDKGHPKAGSYLKRVLASWKFAPYKSGLIRYYFNVPSRMETMKVQVDLRQLEKNKRFLSFRETVKDGMIYFIQGLDSRNIFFISG